MNNDMIEMLMKLDNQYLCELYTYSNEQYFINYIEDNKEGINYYKQIIDTVGETLRNRGYWKY